MIQTAHLSTNCLATAKEYFQGKGPLYWKLEKINCIAVNALLALTILSGIALIGTGLFAGGWSFIEISAPLHCAEVGIKPMIDSILGVAKLIAYFFAGSAAAAFIVSRPLSTRDNGAGMRGKEEIFYEALSSKIDRHSLSDLTRWRTDLLPWLEQDLTSGKWKDPTWYQNYRAYIWRHASWEEIGDFYRSVRTPAELTARIEREGFNTPSAIY